MGHRSFISSLVIIDQLITQEEVFAISGSGDGTLISWSLTSGKQLDSYVFDQGTLIYITSIVYYKLHSIAIVICEGLKSIYFFSVSIPGCQLNLIQTINLPSFPLSIAITNDTLSISTLENGLLQIPVKSNYPFQLDDYTYQINLLNQKLKLTENINETAKNQILKKLSLVSLTKNLTLKDKNQKKKNES